jgi:hypothetical protein
MFTYSAAQQQQKRQHGIERLLHHDQAAFKEPAHYPLHDLQVATLQTASRTFS